MIGCISAAFILHSAVTPAAEAAAEKLALPYSCAKNANGISVVRGPISNLDVVGPRTRSTFELCETDRSRDSGGACLPVEVQRFDVLCGTHRVAWPDVAEAITRLNRISLRIRQPSTDSGGSASHARSAACHLEPVERVRGRSTADTRPLSLVCRDLAADGRIVRLRIPQGYAPLGDSGTIMRGAAAGPRTPGRHALASRPYHGDVHSDLLPDITPLTAKRDTSETWLDTSAPDDSNAAETMPAVDRASSEPVRSEPALAVDHDSGGPGAAETSSASTEVHVVSLDTPLPPEGAWRQPGPALEQLSYGDLDGSGVLATVSGLAMSLSDEGPAAIPPGTVKAAMWSLGALLSAALLAAAIGRRRGTSVAAARAAHRSRTARRAAVAEGGARGERWSRPTPVGRERRDAIPDKIAEAHNAVAAIRAGLEDNRRRLDALQGTGPLTDVLGDELQGVAARLAALEAQASADEQTAGRASAGFRNLVRELERIRRIIDSAAVSMGRADDGDASSANRIPVTRAEAYALLGLNPDAPEGTLKKVADGLRMGWHPDHARNDDDRSVREARIKAINAAVDLINGKRTAA